MKCFLKECKTRTEAARKLIAANTGKTVDAKVPFKPTKRPPRPSAQPKAVEQDKDSEPGADDRQKPGKTIPVQPRDLFRDFSQDERAQDDPDQSCNSVDPHSIGETTGNSIVLHSDLKEDDSSTKSSTLQLGQYSQSQPSITQVLPTQPDEDLTMTQQSKKAYKKVHWHDRTNSEDKAVDPTLPEARRKNATFGSNRSVASISSHSTVQTSNKAAKASDARHAVLAKARSSTIDHHSTKKSSSRGKIPEGKTKASDCQSQRKISSGDDMCVREQGLPCGDEKSDIGPSSSQGRGISNIRSGTAATEPMGRVSSTSGDAIKSSNRSASEKNCGTFEESKKVSSTSKNLASRKSDFLRSTKVSSKESSADEATAAKKSKRHSTGEAGKVQTAGRSNSGRKKSHSRMDDDTGKKLLVPSKKHKTDLPVVEASRPRISKDARKSDTSNAESIKNKLDVVVPSDKRSAKAKAVSTAATKRTKHSTSAPKSTDLSRSPKRSHSTQSTGIPSQEIPRGRRRWPKAQAVTGRGKKPRMEKFVDDFNFSFE